MRLRTLIIRSFRFRALSHLAAIAGIAIAAAAITGAFIVGDSVKLSLRGKALDRTAGADWAIVGGDRFFRQDLASVHTSGVPLLVLQGVARHSSGAARANSVQLIGADERFFDRSGQVKTPVIKGNEVYLNRALAEQLGAGNGDEIILRLRRPGLLAADAALSPGKTEAAGLRVTVAGILPSRNGGDLDLRGSGRDVLNVFLPLATLQKEAQLEAKVNLVLARNGRQEPDASGLAEAWIQKHWTAADAGLEVTHVPGGLDIRTPRVFLDDPSVHAARGAASNCIPVLTYLVNLIEHRTNATPYSMVSAIGPPYTPADLAGDEILITAWLAEDLAAGPGSVLRLSYFLPESGGGLAEATNEFRVKAVLPMRLPWADRSLMPDFPGIQEAERAHDWDVGFPLTYPIRDKDEAYWKEYRGTPKAFISPDAGQKLWANRFGNYTSIRIPEPGMSQEQLANETLARLTPAQAGLRVVDLKSEALSAANKAQDFGQLFLAFSLCILASALLLTGLLVQFGMETRAIESGTLLALGFSPGRLRWLLIGEGVLTAFVGSCIGVMAGIGYAQALLWALSKGWSAAVGGLGIEPHITASALFGGLLSSIFAAALVMFQAARRQSRRAPAALLSGETEPPPTRQASGRGAWLAMLAVAAAAALLGWSALEQELNPGVFFGAGSLLLLAGCAGFRLLLGRMKSKHSELTLGALVLRSGARRPRRSLAVVALLSAGCFIIVGVSAFRLQETNVRDRHSGTGGFDILASSSLPIVHELRSQRGRDAVGLSGISTNTIIVPFRVKEGDEASCLNLNRAAMPRLLGVQPALLKGRFQFAGNSRGGWGRLSEWTRNEQSGAIEIPAIGDANSIQWSMGKSVGDTIPLVSESGKPVALRIVGSVANSILQGSLVVDEAALLAAFPGVVGHRFFFIESGEPSAQISQEVAASMTFALEDYGFEATAASRRMASLNAVQNTFLAAFQMLGAVGLLLGSVGLGVLVLRNVLERRAELAVMLAAGWCRRRLIRLVSFEHALLLLFGLAIGALAAVIAILPGILIGGVSWPALMAALLLVLCNGLLWTWFASRLAMRGPLLESLRKE